MGKILCVLLVLRINVDNIDTYACSVPDVIAVGGDVTAEALIASSSLVIDCMVEDKHATSERNREGIRVSETIECRL